MNTLKTAVCAIGILLGLPCPNIHAAFPPGYRLMAGSGSPDGTLGILEPAGVPDEAFWKTHNLVAETKSGRVIGTLEGVPGMKQMNHGGAEARWSADGGLLLWFVDGKWGPRTVTFVGVENNGIVRQVDLIKQGYAKILKKAKSAFPKAYAAAVKQNQGNGAAYPEGFTVALTLKNNGAVLPAEFVVTMTSNPKGIEDFPKQAELDGYLFGTLTKKWEIRWGKSEIFNSTTLERLAYDEEGASEVLAHQWDATLESLNGKQREKLTANQQEWETRIQGMEESWPLAGSVSVGLATTMRSDAYLERDKTLSDMSKK